MMEDGIGTVQVIAVAFVWATAAVMRVQTANWLPLDLSEGAYVAASMAAVFLFAQFASDSPWETVLLLALGTGAWLAGYYVGRG